MKTCLGCSLPLYSGYSKKELIPGAKLVGEKGKLLSYTLRCEREKKKEEVKKKGRGMGDGGGENAGRIASRQHDIRSDFRVVLTLFSNLYH